MKYHGLVLGVCAGANALAISEPTKRQDAGYLQQPDPTPHVGMAGMRHLALDKRQDSGTTSAASVMRTFTIVVASDSTCGFLSASPGNAITCDNSQKCSWELSYNTAIFCGSRAYNRCWEREDATNTDICDDICQSNEYNLLCTETASPYCGTYAYPGGIRDFKCVTSRATRVQSVDTTYKGQNNRVFGTTLLNDETTVALDDLTKSTESSATESESSTTTESAEPTESSEESNSGGGKKSTPVGAIVGGAIGGFVALSLVVLAAVWFWKKNKKTDAAVAPPMQQQQQYQQPPAGAMPPPHATEAPADSVPPMYQNYPKSEVTSPTQSEWRESMITAQSATTPVSNQGWGGQYPSNGGQNEVHEMPHDNYGRQA